jgi:ketosteroid isomerase-like protein
MRALALIAAFAAACGGGGGGGAVKPKGPVGPAVEGKQAEKDAAGLVTEIYDNLGRGNKDSLFTLLDNSLVVFGPRKVDALARTDALVSIGQVVDPKTKKVLRLRSSSLEVVASEGGRSAWAFDLVNINGEPHAMMAILSNADDLWLVAALSVAHTPGGKSMKDELARDAVVPPGAMGPKKVDPDARGAVEKFQKGLLDQELWGTDLSSRSDSVVVGPTVGEVARGKKEIKKLWKKRVELKTRAAASGEVTAQVTADGQIAWVSAPITRVAEGSDPLPLRAFAVFEKAGGDWKMIALHESLAFDEPGSGASFRKILPPKPEEPKPPEVEKPKGDDKPKVDPKKKKKKKKKPAAKDE